MEERIHQFQEWLVTEKNISQMEAGTICSLYQRVNAYLLTKENGRNNLFQINDVKTYNKVCNKWLAGKFVSMVLKNDAIEFTKRRKLYAEFLDSDSFITGAEKEQVEENLEVSLEDMRTPLIEETEAVITEPSTTPQEQILPVQTLEQTIFGKCKEVVEAVFTEGLPRLDLQSREKGIAYFDIANESFRMDTEQANQVMYIRTYSTVNGKVFRHDERYLGDFTDDSSTYQTLFYFSENGQTRLIEKSIKDSLERYKVDFAYCLLPDLLDEFNHEIRNQISYNGKKLFLIPKSVALLFSLLKKNHLLAEKEYYVADYDGDELSVTCLSTKKNDDGSVKIVRRGLCRTQAEHLNFTKLSAVYLDKYCQKYSILLTELQKDKLSKSKELLRLYETKKPILVRGGDSYYVIKYDVIIFQEIKREYDKDVQRLRKEIGEKKTLLVINSLFENNGNYHELFDGAAEIHRRIVHKEYLWEEYLPQLSLEVIMDGRFEEIELIPQNECRDILKVVNSEEIIAVKGTVTLGAGKEQYRLPLKREVIGSINAQKEACLKHASFPLKKSVQVRMEIHYKYGDEDSYKLIFYPLSEAPFISIENVWKDVERIEEISPPKMEEVSQTMQEWEIEFVQNAIEQARKNLERIKNRARFNWTIGENSYTGQKEVTLFRGLNKLYAPRRKFFSTYMCKKSKNIKNCIKEMFACDLIKSMYHIIIGKLEWVTAFTREEYPIVRVNVERLLVDMGVIYALELSNDDAKLVEKIITYFINKNKLWQLVPLSRCIKKDRYGVFDCIARKIIDKVEQGEFTISDMQTISSNCWQSKEWIENLFKAQDGPDAIACMIDKATDVILEYNVKTIRGTNPRKIRDVLELLLCCTRANEYKKKQRGQVYFEPNSQSVKQLVEKIKLIDKYMDTYKDTLQHPFISRLNANVVEKDVSRMNEITYMLVQTLTGKERIELIGFSEDA